MPARSRAPSSAFAALHAGPGFVMPNAWDAGSARVLEAAGFAAIGTTSAGIAFSAARQDYSATDAGLLMGRDAMLARAAEIAAAVRAPVNADLEAGYGDAPEAVAETVRLAIEAGLAGANIEDRPPMTAGLYDEGLAVERIAAAAEAARAMDPGFVLTARCDALALPAGHPDGGMAAAIRRSNRYLEAGAGCAFTPGAARIGEVGRLAAEIAGPLNMVLGLGTLEGNAFEWIAAGVRRVSLGGTFARAALGFVARAAAELRETGGVAWAEGQLSHAELNALFARD